MQTRNVILQGTVGSTAYGLAREGSDVDSLGVYVAPLRDVMGLRGPTVVSESHNTHDPDLTLHEVGKYLSLGLKANPTVLELLFLPADLYTLSSPAGWAIIAKRAALLSDKLVRSAYGGYATQQVHRLLNRMEEGKEGFSSDVKTRTEKHARHTFRLIMQGQQLINTGTMNVNVGDKRDYLFEMGRLAAEEPGKFVKEFDKAMENFNGAESVLPEAPDTSTIENLLIDIRYGWFNQ